MKIEVKKIDATRRELRFEIPKERVSQKFDEVYQEIGRTTAVKGYRPGKAPRPVLEVHHGQWAKEETIKKLIPEIYQEGLQKENITPFDLPEIQDVALKDGSLSFTARLDIKPEVRLRNYKGIYVKRKNSEVPDEELSRALELLKKDPQDPGASLDDAFAKGLGYPNMEALKDSLKRQMAVERDRQSTLDLENQIMEYLLKEASVVIPGAAVNRQFELRLKEAHRSLHAQGLPEEEIKKKEDEMRPNLRVVAEKDLKLFLTIEHIAKLENITVAENESLFHKVMEFLLKEAKWEEAR